MSKQSAETRIGKCHCGEIEFEVTLDNGIENIRRCNCSLCNRKGAAVAGVPLENLKVIKGADTIKLYQWNTNTAKHYFCGTCGIYTHHQRRSNPNEFGFNIGCLDIDISNVGDIPTGDGASLSLVSKD